jgi:O-acetyl-ADP-ribose deacetylase (regulator of RNase III)
VEDSINEIKVGQGTLQLLRGDITAEETDAIVNAANSALAGGGGVDGAIHRAGGPEIMRECNRLDGCPTGSAVITTAGLLAARYVIHTVGPVYRGGTGGEPKLLSSAYRSSLTLAAESGLRSVSFPSISTGVYGYPTDEAARIALNTVIAFLKEHPSTEPANPIEVVRFILFSEEDLDIYARALGERLSGPA